MEGSLNIRGRRRASSAHHPHRRGRKSTRSGGTFVAEVDCAIVPSVAHVGKRRRALGETEAAHSRGNPITLCFLDAQGER